MATREQIVAKLVSRRVNSVLLPNLTRQQIRQAAQGLTNQQWDGIISGVRSNNPADVGMILRERALQYLRAAANTDIEDALSPDDTLTVAELEGLL